MTQDRIERDVVVAAGLDDAWRALTDAARLSEWFATSTELDLRPGGAVTFTWRSGERTHAVVEAVEPPRRFAYRWCLEHDVPVDAGPTTLVEFTLTEDPSGGTRVRLVESGFGALPDGPVRWPENDDGWRDELRELEALLDR